MKIESLLSNPMVKNLLFGTLKKFAKENGIRSITLKLSEDGVLDDNDIVLHKEPVKIMTMTEYNNLLNSLQQ